MKTRQKGHSNMHKYRFRITMLVIWDVFIAALIIYALAVQNYINLGSPAEQTITVTQGNSITASFNGNARNITGLVFDYVADGQADLSVIVRDADGSKDYYHDQMVLEGNGTCSIQLHTPEQSKKEVYVSFEVSKDSAAALKLFLAENPADGCHLLYEGKWQADGFLSMQLHTSDYDRLAVLLFIMGLTGNVLILFFSVMADTKKTECIVSVIYIVVILMLSLWNFDMLDGPIGGDQPGYWGHALNLSGRFGKYLVSTWFAGGYSILLSIPMRVFSSARMVYQFAAAGNAFFGVCMYLVLHQIIRKLSGMSVLRSLTISFAVSCYSAHLFQRGIAWPETLIYLLFLCIILTMMYFAEMPTVRNACMLGCLAGYIYIVHNRTIVVMTAVVLTAVFLFCKKRVQFHSLSVLTVCIILCYICSHYLKNYFSMQMWDDIGRLDGNSIISVLKNMSANGDLLLLLYSLLGKIWYLLSATYGLAGIGMIFWMRSLYLGFRSNSKHTYLYFYIVLCLFGTIAVDVLSALPKTGMDHNGFRLDTIIYGRYEEQAAGILLAGAGICLVRIKNRKSLLKLFGIVLLAYLVSSIGMFIYCYQYRVQNPYVTVPCIPGVYFDSSFSFLRYSLAGLVVCILIFAISTAFLQKENAGLCDRKAMIVCPLALVCLFLETSYAGNVDYTINFTRGWNVYADLIEFCDACQDIPFYLDKSAGNNLYWQIGMRAMDTKCFYYTVKQKKNEEKTDFEYLYVQPADNQYILLRNMQSMKDDQTAYLGYYYLGTFASADIGVYTKNKKIADRVYYSKFDGLQEKHLVTRASRIYATVDETSVEAPVQDPKVFDDAGAEAGKIRQIIWEPGKGIKDGCYSIFVQIELDNCTVLDKDCMFFINGAACTGNLDENGILTITKDVRIV